MRPACRPPVERGRRRRAADRPRTAGRWPSSVRGGRRATGTRRASAEDRRANDPRRTRTSGRTGRRVHHAPSPRRQARGRPARTHASSPASHRRPGPARRRRSQPTGHQRSGTGDRRRGTPPRRPGRPDRRRSARSVAAPRDAARPAVPNADRTPGGRWQSRRHTGPRDQAGTGASAWIKPSCLSSAHRSPGMSWPNVATFRETWSAVNAPGITAATDGCPSGNCRAAAASGTP